MSFIAPLFFVALAALAIPVLIHLFQREKKQILRFPSLMFVQRVPYKSIQRRRVHNWLLLLVRLAVLTLIVFAFARPFFERQDLGTATGGAREVVVLLDQSYSIGYADRWERAQAAASEAIDGLGPADRGSVVLFSSGAEIALRSTAAGERDRLIAAIEAAEPTAGATRFAPALKVAGGILADSPLPRREVILVSDFQRGGWRGEEGASLPDGATLTPVLIAGGAEAPNVAVTAVSLARSMFSNQERVVATAVVANRGTQSLTGGQLALEIDGRPIQTERLDVEAGSSASVTFAPFTLADSHMRGSVRAGTDALAADNVFNFVVSPVQPVGVVVVDRGGTGSAALYLTRALAIGDTPRFETTVRQPNALSDDDLRRASIVVLNDVAVPASLGRRLARFVDGGGGLFVALGPRATWPQDVDILPAALQARVDRTRGDAARIGALEYGPSRVRAVSGAPKRKLFRRADLRLSRGRARAVRAGVGAVRRRRAGAARAADRHRPRAAVGIDPRPCLERPPAEACVSSLRPPRGAISLCLHGTGALVDRRPGAGRVVRGGSVSAWGRSRADAVRAASAHRGGRLGCAAADRAGVLRTPHRGRRGRGRRCGQQRRFGGIRSDRHGSQGNRRRGDSRCG